MAEQYIFGKEDFDIKFVHRGDAFIGLRVVCQCACVWQRANFIKTNKLHSFFC